MGRVRVDVLSLRTILSIIFVIAVLGFAWYYVRRPEPVEPPPEPAPPIEVPVLTQIPKAYRAQADGTITIEVETSSNGLTSVENVEATGRVRMGYRVYPDNRVVIDAFNVWMGDANLDINFLFWEAHRERLRCTEFYSERTINGVFGNDRITIPAGTTVQGHTYERRGSDGKCGGTARLLDVESPEEMDVIHEPDNDNFGIHASFTFDHEGDEITVVLNADGDFINRPPVAEFELSGPDVQVMGDGCPVGVANTEEGLQVALRSTSFDPDGNYPEGIEIKDSRMDISFEQWARSTPEGLMYLGEGQDGGTQLFEIGPEHQLILWVTDRQGAEARKLCNFRVKERS